MTAPITSDQLVNASIDADSLALAVNGDELTTVTTRLGRQYPTFAKMLADLLAQWESDGIVSAVSADAEAAAASAAAAAASAEAAAEVAAGGLGPNSITNSMLTNGIVTSAKLTTDATDRALIASYLGVTKIVPSMDGLRSSSALVSPVVFVTGYWPGSYKGGGMFVYDPSDVSTADNQCTVIVVGTWRYKLNQASPVTYHQCGAKGDGVTDDRFYMQFATDRMPTGSKIILPLGQFRVSQTLSITGGITIEGVSRDSQIDQADCCIVGDATVSPVVQTSGVTTTAPATLKCFSITRAGGAPDSALIGLQCTACDQQVFEDLNIWKHGIAIDVAGQLCPYFHRCNTWHVSNYHVRIQNTVEPYFYKCRFGRNGNADITSNGYILIQGTGVDTTRFESCQMNQSGATAGVCVMFSGYTNANGIHHFINCHMENWNAACFAASGGTTSVQRVKVIGCSCNQATANLPFLSAAAGVFTELIISACTIDASATFDSIYKVIINACEWSGGSMVLNAGYGAVSGNTFAIPVTCQGAFVHFAVTGNAMLSGFGFGSATGGFVQTGNV